MNRHSEFDHSGRIGACSGSAAGRRRQVPCASSRADWGLLCIRQRIIGIQILDNQPISDKPRKISYREITKVCSRRPGFAR